MSGLIGIGVNEHLPASLGSMSLTSTVSITARRQAEPVPVIAGSCPDRLVRAIRAEVRRGLGWQDTADCVAAALRVSLPDPAEVLPASLRRGDPAGYQSHLLYAEPDGSFSISVMVWMPGQQPMIRALQESMNCWQVQVCSRISHAGSATVWLREMLGVTCSNANRSRQFYAETTAISTPA